MLMWNEKEFFVGMTGERLGAHITSVEEPDEKNAACVVRIMNPAAEHFSNSSVLNLHVYLDRKRELLTVVVPVATQIPVSYYGFALDFVNRTTNECGRGYLIKTHVDPPQPTEQYLSLYCSWDFSLEGGLFREQATLTHAQEYVAQALLRISDECCDLITSFYEDSENVSFA